MGTIGVMNRKIEIQEPTTTKSSMGAPVKSFAHLAYLWAERTKVSDVPEQYIDNRLVLPSRYKYKVHYDSSLDETMRIIDDNISFNILSLDRIDRLFLEIIAERITE